MAASTNLKDYLGKGNKADRPASLTLASGEVGIYWAVDTDEVSYWEGGAWSAWFAPVGAKTRQFLTSTATLTPANTDEECGVNAQAAALSIAAPAGTWQDGDTLVFRIKDNGTTRAITWNAAYVWIGSAYTNTTAGKWAYITAIYNATDSKWHLMPAQVQA